MVLYKPLSLRARQLTQPLDRVLRMWEHVGYHPNDLSEDFNPIDSSEDFNPSDLSEDFNPIDLSEDFNPNDLSEGFNPSDLSEDFNPSWCSTSFYLQTRIYLKYFSVSWIFSREKHPTMVFF